MSRTAVYATRSPNRLRVIGRRSLCSRLLIVPHHPPRDGRDGCNGHHAAHGNARYASGRPMGRPHAHGRVGGLTLLDRPSKSEATTSATSQNNANCVLVRYALARGGRLKAFDFRPYQKRRSCAIFHLRIQKPTLPTGLFWIRE